MKLVKRSHIQPNRFARELFDQLPPQYDRLSYLLSFGQDRRWRSAMVDRVVSALQRDTLQNSGPLSRPASILDVATGPGGVAIELARRTGARVTGVDLTPSMLEEAQESLKRCGLDDRVNLTLARGESLPFANHTFDAVTFEYLLRYTADTQATLDELIRVLKPGGVLTNLEFHVPPKLHWRQFWYLYTYVLLPLAGALTGGRAWFQVGRFLGPSIRSFYQRHTLHDQLQMWRNAGIADVSSRVMSLGGGVVIWGTKEA